MHNPEDKSWWVNKAVQTEVKFVQVVCPYIGLPAQMNPRKREDPYAPDIIVEKKLSDLKYQETPFFKAWELYKIPNQYAVTFNHKDYLRYKMNYPEIVIYFWVKWKQLTKQLGHKLYSVYPMNGIWRIHFPRLAYLIEKENKPLHGYQRRTNDTTGNAKESYVFDVRTFEQLFLKETK
jgi:hypothetical protein